MTRADRAVARVARGHSVKSVADAMGYTPSGLSTVCNRRGVYSKLPRDEQKRREITDALERGWTDADIAQEWGVPISTPRAWRKDWKRRKR